MADITTMGEMPPKHGKLNGGSEEGEVNEENELNIVLIQNPLDLHDKNKQKF